MRLREPFAGYKLTSGHFMFHIAFLIGTFLPLDWDSNKDVEDIPHAKFTFMCLRYAHVLVPLLDMMGFIADVNGHYHLEKVFDTLTIFLYQTTIFQAQYHQMASNVISLTGYNLWFTIEIVSYYGYITSAMLFIFDNSIMSTLGYLNQDQYKDRYRHDFINYHRKELDWFAFLIILLSTTSVLMYINYARDQKCIELGEGEKKEPLRYLMWVLCAIHIL